MPESLKNPEINEALKKKSLICACSEGEERSVFAKEIFKKYGFQYVSVLPGGLEGLRALRSESNTAKSERQFNRGIRGAFATNIFEERKNEAEYKKLLRRNATWLLFLDKNSEAKFFQDTISQLRIYNPNVIVLHSWDKDSVTNEILNFIQRNK